MRIIQFDIPVDHDVVKGGALPERSRTIRLESCLLETLALPVDRRLRAWAEGVKRIPGARKALRSGYRASNNAFRLRAAIEKACAL